MDLIVSVTTPPASTLVLALVLAGLIGFLSGMFGIGGSFLLVPMLNLLPGVGIGTAVGTGACQVLGPSTTSILARRRKQLPLKVPLILFGGILLGLRLGDLSLTNMEEQGVVRWGAYEASLVEVGVLSVYFVVLTSLGLFIVWETSSWRRMPMRNRQVNTFESTTLKALPHPTDRISPLRVVLSSYVGFCIGYLSAVMGISGGLFLLPGLVYLFGYRTHQATSMSMVTVWMIAIPMTLTHALRERIDLWLLCASLMGGTLGAHLGVKFSLRTAGRQLRRWFSALLLSTSLLVLGQLWWAFRRVSE